MTSTLWYLNASNIFCITTLTFCGILRSCNFWKFTGKSINELYPARRAMITIFFLPLLLIPCIINPTSEDAHLFSRCFWLSYYTTMCNIALRDFFMLNMPKRNTHIYALIFFLSIVFIFACFGKDILYIYKKPIDYIFLLLCLINTIEYLKIFKRLYGFIKMSFTKKDKPSSFPRIFAIFVLSVTTFFIFFTYLTFFANSIVLDIIFVLLSTVCLMVITVIILHPQRENVYNDLRNINNIKNNDTITSQLEDKKRYNISSITINNIEAIIRSEVEDNKLYLDPKFSRQDLADRVKINLTYISKVLALRMGSFNEYINNLRLEYAKEYQKNNPDAPKKEVAFKSGFGSVKSYNRALQKVEEITKEK